MSGIDEDIDEEIPAPIDVVDVQIVQESVGFQPVASPENPTNNGHAIYQLVHVNTGANNPGGEQGSPIPRVLLRPYVGPSNDPSQGPNSDMDTDSSDIEDFDRDLPGEHSYLGSNMECVGGRTVLDEGGMYSIPLLAHQNIIFPGETIPMLAPATQVAKLFHTIENSHMFGLVCPDESGEHIFKYGVTCEIYEGEPEVRDMMRVKAKARQRFRIIGPFHSLREYLSVTMQKVQILPEETLGDPLMAMRLLSLDRVRANKRLQSAVRRAEAVQTQWPAFIYNMYDEQLVMQRIRKYFSRLQIDSMPSDPIMLSFWVARNMQIDTRLRLGLFKENCALRRLRMELLFLENFAGLVCSKCDQEMAKTADLFAMSSDGIQSHYVNPDGWIHETFTVHHAEGAQLQGRPSTRSSWFPGYAWTIALCKNCHQHVGWRFTATKRMLRPQAFWGLCRGSVHQGFRLEETSPNQLLEIGDIATN